MDIRPSTWRMSYHLSNHSFFTKERSKKLVFLNKWLISTMAGIFVNSRTMKFIITVFLITNFCLLSYTQYFDTDITFLNYTFCSSSSSDFSWYYGLSKLQQDSTDSGGNKEYYTYTDSEGEFNSKIIRIKDTIFSIYSGNRITLFLLNRNVGDTLKLANYHTIIDSIVLINDKKPILS